MRRCLVLTSLVLALPASATAATRYASPTGGGSDCTQTAPCGLSVAVNGAVGGDEVVLASGTYGSSASPVHLDDPVGGITVRGTVVGPDRPVIGANVSFDEPESRLRDVQVDSAAGPPLYIQNGAAADRVVIRSTDPGVYDGCEVFGPSTIRNALCIKDGPTGGTSGLALQGGSASARNVTAVGTGYGLFALAPATVEATIAQGSGKEDAYVFYNGVTFRDVLYQDLNPNGYAPTDTGRIDAAPIFAGPGDYRQGAGSPTIDAGDLEDASVLAGELDLNGNLRRIGAHIDVGAYERPPVPAAAVGQPRTTASGATFTGNIQTGGGRAEAYFAYGPGFASRTSTQVIPATLSATPVTATVNDLGSAPTPYRLVVTTDGGTTISANQTAYRAPTLTLGSPSAVTQTRATLNGTVALKGAPSARVQFVYGAATSPAQTVTVDGPVKARVAGLKPGTTYKTKLRVARGGEVFETPLGSFTTAKALKPTFALAVPKGSTRATLLLTRRSLTVRVRCGPAACRVTASGVVRAGTRRLGRLHAPTKPLGVRAGRRGAIVLSSSRALRESVRRSLKAHPERKVVLTLTAIFRDADGKRFTRRVAVRVRLR